MADEIVKFSLNWDEVGGRNYETGIDRVVLYTMRDTITDDTDPYNAGVAWSGVTAINETPSGGEPTDLWADNIKYLSLISSEQFGATIEAYMYPPEFYACDGTVAVATGAYIGQQTRKMFGLSYRSIIGNDINFNDYGYKLHLVYGCFATPSEKGHATVNDSPEAVTFSWTINTTPVSVGGFKPTAHMVIDSTTVDPEKLVALEKILYGTPATTNPAVDAVAPKLLLPDAVITTLS